MKTISNFNCKDKKVLVRVDFNVPQDENLNVTDNTRITAVKPTVDKILSDGGSVILMTHLGRPKGSRASCWDDEASYGAATAAGRSV